jgi:hypothetical protein
MDDVFAEVMRAQEWPISVVQSKEDRSELWNQDLWNDTTQDDVTTFTGLDYESTVQIQSTSLAFVSLVVHVQSTMTSQSTGRVVTSTSQVQNAMQSSTASTVMVHSTTTQGPSTSPVVQGQSTRQSSAVQGQATVMGAVQVHSTGIVQLSTVQGPSTAQSSDVMVQSTTTQGPVVQGQSTRQSSAVQGQATVMGPVQVHSTGIVQLSTVQAQSSDVMVQSMTARVPSTPTVLAQMPLFEVVKGLETLGPVQVLLAEMELGVPSSTSETVFNPIESVSIIFPAGAWSKRRGFAPLTLRIFLLPNKTCGPVIDLGPREKTLLSPIKVSLHCPKNAQAFRLNTTNGNWVKNQDQTDVWFSTTMLGVYGVMEIPEPGLDNLWIAVGTSLGTMILLVGFVICIRRFQPPATITAGSSAELCFARV